MACQNQPSAGTHSFLRPLSAASSRLSAVLFGLFLLAVGLWPFNPHATNQVRVLPDGKGLKFGAPDEHSKRSLGGMVFTPSPLTCQQRGGCTAGALSIAIELSADSDARSCIKRIVDFRRSDGSEVFFLGQWKSSLIVRSFNTPSAGGKPYREIGVGGVLSAGQTRLVSIVSGINGTRTYVDGHLVKSDPGIRLLKENETLYGHKAYLGNSPELSCAWAGRVQSLALFGKAWDSTELAERRGSEPGGLFRCTGDGGLASACYRFDTVNGETIPDLSVSGNDLRKPAHLVFEKRFLELPDNRSLSISDLTLNLLGFVPLGSLICLCLLKRNRRRKWVCLLWAVGVGCAVSLTIELAQIWLPGRDSSLLDLAANTTGSAIGGIAIALRSGSYSGRQRITSDC
jgi:VanZ family protein